MIHTRFNKVYTVYKNGERGYSEYEPECIKYDLKESEFSGKDINVFMEKVKKLTIDQAVSICNEYEEWTVKCEVINKNDNPKEFEGW